MEHLTLETIEIMLAPDKLGEILEIDSTASRPFGPVVKLRDGLFVDNATAVAGESFAEWIYRVSRDARRRR